MSLPGLAHTALHFNIDSERPGRLRAQDDEQDSGLLGFAIITRRLQEYKDLATVQFTFVDDFRPGVFEALLTEVKERCQDRSTLLCEMLFAPASLDTDPRALALRAAGFTLGMVEQLSILAMDNAPTPVLPPGIRAVIFEGYVPPAEYVVSFLEIMTIADEGLPGSVPAESSEWTLERLQRAAKINAGADKRVINALLVDERGVTAFSYAITHASTPNIAEQEVTVSHRRVRGLHHGLAVKAVLWQAIAERCPEVTRVTTYNATTNAPSSPSMPSWA